MPSGFAITDNRVGRQEPAPGASKQSLGLGSGRLRAPRAVSGASERRGTRWNPSATLFEVNPWEFQEISKMASGAELIRKIKEQIREVDPKEVHDAVANGNGARPLLIDVREQHEFEDGHIPGAVHVPRGHLESRIEGKAGDKSQPIVLYCASGQRSALAAHTLQSLLGYEDVASMYGGITLWKEHGYEVETPRALNAEQKERYSRHLLLPEIGLEGQLKLLDAKVLLPCA